MGGIPVPCVVDSGSEVSTITESFFKEYMSNRHLNTSTHWLKLTAANGLDIPYIGYLELDIETCGELIPHRGVLVMKDPPSHPSNHNRKLATPGLLGMNVLSALKEKSTDTTWSSIMHIDAHKDSNIVGFAKIAGKDPVLIPAESVSVVRVVGVRSEFIGKDVVVSPLSSGQSPKNVLLVNTLTTARARPMYVRIANLPKTDTWLQPRPRVGVIHSIADVNGGNTEAVVWRQDTECEVEIQLAEIDKPSNVVPEIS